MEYTCLYTYNSNADNNNYNSTYNIILFLCLGRSLMFRIARSKNTLFLYKHVIYLYML